MRLTLFFRAAAFLDLGLFSPIFANGFHRAAVHGLDALLALVVVLRLLIDIGVSLVLFTGEIVRRRFTAQVTIDTLTIYIERAFYVFRIFIFFIGHGLGGVKILRSADPSPKNA